MMNWFHKSCRYISLALICCVVVAVLAGKPQNNVETVNDPKEWKKLLRTRTNVLVAYSNGPLTGEVGNVFAHVSRDLRGTATLVLVDCAGAGKKLCKKNKASADKGAPLIRHYKDGDYHKDYDRRMSVASMSTFLRDPSGDLPWDEDANGVDVVHINDMHGLTKLLKNKATLLMMFYAPWCGFCKRLKPDYSAAATEIKSEGLVLAAMDVNKPENSPARVKYNITGFPTLVYFENGKVKFQYEGENSRSALVSFMRNPEAPAVQKPAEEAWSDTPSDVHHLTADTFHAFIKSEPSVLVMFYAPWCGHCKSMKPEYIAAAAELSASGAAGKLAAVEATKESVLATEFEVKGFPTIKYFGDGVFQFDVPRIRDKAKIIEFMLDPKEPPPPPAPEAPWSSTESDVVHLTEETFKPTLKKKKHVLVMFYAPWCGHCKKAKPELTAAAAVFRDDPKVEFSAVDCTVERAVCSAYDVKGYPTFIYFNYFKNNFPYTGGRTEKDFVEFMTNPEKEVKAPAAEDDWSGLIGNEKLLHLTTSNFNTVLKGKKALVMFYAPWCGHCKAMKADFALAAKDLSETSAGYLATVDATQQKALSSMHSISGFPTLLYFVNGVKVAEYDKKRTREDLVDFMKEKAKTHKTEL